MLLLIFLSLLLANMLFYRLLVLSSLPSRLGERSWIINYCSICFTGPIHHQSDQFICCQVIWRFFAEVIPNTLYTWTLLWMSVGVCKFINTIGSHVKGMKLNCSDILIMAILIISLALDHL